jgi:DNA-binding CsgD family transcriptional regulator
VNHRAERAAVTKGPMRGQTGPAAGLAVASSPENVLALVGTSANAGLRLLDSAAALVAEVAALARPLVVLELGVLEALGPEVVPAVLAARPAATVTVRRIGTGSGEAVRPAGVGEPASWIVGLLVGAAGNGHSGRPARLTARESDVLSAIAVGHTNAEIARCLRVSEDTVKTHVRRIFSRLGARDRAHAVAIAMRGGLIR